MILLLDSTRGIDLRVGLADGRRLRTLRRTFETPASAELLGLVDDLLRGAGCSPRDLTGIVVANGPGPFSALRAACAVANAASYVLRVPTVGVRGRSLTARRLVERGKRALRRAKLGVPVVPFYGKPPNITTPKRR